MATPSLLEPADHLEQPLGLAIGQRRGRLVHHQDARVLRQRLGDLDDLLVGDAELVHEPVADRCRSRCWRARAAGLAPHGRAVDRAGKPAARLAAEEDVLRDAQIGDEREFLEDDRDAELARIVGTADLDALAVVVESCRRRRV